MAAMEMVEEMKGRHLMEVLELIQSYMAVYMLKVGINKMGDLL